MKIKMDFVTNSSSTSFIIICKGEFTREAFTRLTGVSPASPLKPVFDSIYDSLLERMKPMEEEYRLYGRKNGEIHTWLCEMFCDTVAEKAISAKQEGKSVYVGALSSDSDSIQTFFCCENIELEEEDLYFNALKSFW